MEKVMKKKLSLLFTILLFILVTSASALAEKDGGEIVYENTGKLAPVHFSHKAHLDAGNQCADCHDAIFQKKVGSAASGNEFTMKNLKAGKFCGVCHDDGKAFTAKKNCGKCHIK